MKAEEHFLWSHPLKSACMCMRVCACRQMYARLAQECLRIHPSLPPRTTGSQMCHHPALWILRTCPHAGTISTSPTETRPFYEIIFRADTVKGK